jgi:hypothetical protein
LNKNIKHKKKNKLMMKKSFKKEDLLFMKKFPRLFGICYMNNIPYKEILNTWKKVKKLKLTTKSEFEVMQHCLIVAKKENYTFKKGSLGYWYKKLFELAGVIKN